MSQATKEVFDLEKAIHEAEGKFATAQAEFKAASAQLNYLLKFREKQHDIDFLRQEYLSRILTTGAIPETTPDTPTTTRTRLTKEQQEALAGDALSILRHGKAVKATDFKTAFLLLPNASESRYNTTVAELIKAKKIVKKGNLQSTTYQHGL